MKQWFHWTGCSTDYAGTTQKWAAAYLQSLTGMSLKGSGEDQSFHWAGLWQCNLLFTLFVKRTYVQLYTNSWAIEMVWLVGWKRYAVLFLSGPKSWRYLCLMWMLAKGDTREENFNNQIYGIIYSVDISQPPFPATLLIAQWTHDKVNMVTEVMQGLSNMNSHSRANLDLATTECPICQKQRLILSLHMILSPE